MRSAAVLLLLLASTAPSTFADSSAQEENGVPSRGRSGINGPTSKIVGVSCYDKCQLPLYLHRVLPCVFRLL
jgi:hypothetical protein